MIYAAMKAGAYISETHWMRRFRAFTLSACRFAVSRSPVSLCLPGEADAQT